MKKLSSWLGVGVVAVVVAMVMLPAARSFADVTGTLFPNGQGTHTSWTGTESDIDETGTPDCTSGDAIITASTSARESVLIDLSSVPNNATIQSISVSTTDRGDSAAGGTYQTFARLNGGITDSGVNLSGTGTGACSAWKSQSINVPDAMKTATTTLEVGVVKTTGGAGSGNAVRVGALHVVIVYVPLTHSIVTASGAGGSVTPGGPVTVDDGNNQSFSITPSAGYIVDDVSVDSSSQGRLNAYTFTNVTANHSISATFNSGWTASGDSDDGDADVTGDANTTASNDNYAQFNNPNDEADFDEFGGLGVPPGATIDGIEVAIEGNRTANRTLDVLLSWNNGASWTSAQTVGSTFTSGDRTVVAGGASDTWGRTWSVSNLSDANFVVRLEGNGGSGDVNVDQLQVKVHYTVAPSTGTFVIRKSVINDNGGTAATSSFSFMVDGGAPVAFEADGQNDVTVSVGDHTAVEAEVEGYDTSYSNCAEMSVTAGTTTICTITNNDQPGHLVIIKDAVGGDGTFNFTVNGGSLSTSTSISTDAGAGTATTIDINANTNYTVDEPTQPSGWDFTSVNCQYEGVPAGSAGPAPTSHVVSVGNGETVTCTYTDTKRASLTITKYSDPAEGSFRFNVAGPDSSMPASTTFNPSGEWNLANLIAGTYSISETILSPEGWSGSQNIACNGNGANDPSGSLAESSLNVTLAAGENMSCVVNNTEDAVVSGKKFEDMDGQGGQDLGPGLSGWTITFYASSTETAYPVTTDEDGNYSVILPPDIYRVCESMAGHSGWYNSWPAFGSEDTISCETDGTGYVLEVGAGANLSGIDFGNYRKGSISGFKWNDADADGVWDEDEFGIGNWTVNLNGDEYADTTNEEGHFSFLVAPGTYTVSEALQSGWAQTYPSSTTYSVTILSNGLSEDNNFGNVADASISGAKWHDANANGLWDEGELGLTGWRIYVDSNNNGSWQSGEPYADTAGEGGTYTIAGLLPGDYVVREVPQDTWQQTYPDEGGAHSVTLAINEDATEIDFGNVHVITIDGQKFGDLNKDGIKDIATTFLPQPDICFPPVLEDTPPVCIPQPPIIVPQPEVGLPNWTIVATPVVSDGEGGYNEDTGSGREAKTTVTDQNGDYSFDFIPTELGYWRLTEQFPAGWTQTFPATPAYHIVNITDPHPAYEPFNFGNWQNPIIQAQKWNDADQDGVRDPGEPTLANWPVALGRVVSSSESSISVEIVALSLTNASGTATLYAPDAGQYVVMEGEQSGWVMSYPNPTRPVTMSVNFADGVTPITLETDSFFDVFLGVNQGGQTVSTGQKYTGEGSVTATLEFGNRTVDGGPTNTITGESGGGGGPQNGPTGGGGGQVLGASTSTPGGNSGGSGSQVLGETTCQLPLSAYLRRGRANNPAVVKDLQNFLNAELKLDPPLPLTGFFGPLTEAAVKLFQVKYYDEVLKPWVDLGLLPKNTATGIVFKMTLWKIQKLGCPGMEIPKPILP